MEVPKFKILYFAPCGLNEGVGGSARLKNMLDILERMGIRIQLISYVPEEKFKVTHERISNYLNTLIICVPKFASKNLRVFALLLIFIYGIRYAKKSDIIFAHSPGILTGFPALILAKIFSKPLIIDHMDIKDPDTPTFIYNSVLKNSSIVFVISRYLEEEVKQLGCTNAVYLPIFLDPAVFQRDSSERIKIRKKLNIGSNEIVIGYAGSFWRIEGIPILLKAFKNLSQRYKNIKMMVIGGRNVPDSDNIPQLVDELELEGKVILIPPQPHESIPKYLSACDILCSPKINCSENRAANPIKIYEYMSMGLPTIASAVGEISNVIENGIDGFLVKPGDVKDLERVIEYIIQNFEEAKEIGERGRKKIINTYSINSARKKIEQVLESMVDRNRRVI